MRYLTGAIVTVGIILGGLYMISDETEAAPETLRVAFPYAKPSRVYEPTKIHMAPEYIFLENVYSTLVEMTPQNPELVGSIADKFSWVGNELHLQIRKDLKTVSGNAITAKDIVFSLKRLLVLSGNTHGNFKDLVCPNVELKNVEQDCPGIRVNGDTVILKAGPRKAFLLYMLAAMDFAIIPQGSVDPKTLAITNYKETSGPYFVDQDSDAGRITLKINPNHFKYSKDLAQKIELVPSDLENPKSSLEDYANGKVDFITTIDLAKAEDVIAFAKSQSDTSLHSTMNIRSFLVTFTERGLKELSKEERISLGKKIQDSFRKSFDKVPGYEVSNQFFPSFGEGSLQKDELEDLSQQYKQSNNLTKKPLKMTVVRIGAVERYQEMFKDAIPNVSVEAGKSLPSFLKYEKETDMPHLFISGPDTGFLEDISLISYTLSAGYFGMSNDERSQWLSQYMAIPEKEKRIEFLRLKHKEAIANGVLVPLMVSPYVAMARKPWKIELSQYFANNPLWLIKRL